MLGLAARRAHGLVRVVERGEALGHGHHTVSVAGVTLALRVQAAGLAQAIAAAVEQGARAVDQRDVARHLLGRAAGTLAGLAKAHLVDRAEPNHLVVTHSTRSLPQ